MKGFTILQIISFTLTVAIFGLLTFEGTSANFESDPFENDAEEEQREVRAAAKASLKSKEFEETGCPNVNPAKNLKLKWITQIPAWYIPMASAHYYHVWVERLTNKSAASANDISNLCLKLLFLASAKPNQPYMVVVGGLKKSVVYKCLATGPHNQNCDSVIGAPDYLPGIDAYETVVATDNNKYILILRCIRNKIKSWFVMSPHAESLNNDAKRVVVGHVAKMGFNSKFSSGIPYGICPKDAPAKKG